jgi:transposase
VERPSSIGLNQERYEQLNHRLETNSLTEEDRALLSNVLKAMLWMSAQLEAGRLGLARLKRLIFGEKTEKRRNLLSRAAEQDEGIPKPKPENEEKQPAPNHGRAGANALTGAPKIFCPHRELKPGDVCPECKRGKLHASIEPGIFVRFLGQTPITATVYETQKLRCGLCGKLFEASLPEGVPAVRWDETAKSMTAVLRYGYGVPHYRQEKLQGDLGIPVADSVLQELSENVADCGHPVYKLLYIKAAQGSQINLDDTTCRILELIRENKEQSPERTGIFTSALISKFDDREITLFISGRNHMGENIEALLQKRSPELPPPRLMTDGSNWLPENLNAVLANCLTHGRRQFIDLKDSFPKEVEYVIDCIAQIYHFDAIAKKQAMTDEARLEYHVKNSRPVIEALKAWCQDQITSKKCEPNSPLGKAIKYLEKRWDKLTLFLRIPGAPLSNDIVERLIKSCVLHRKNSLFYKTQHGAVIGDILMSLIHTAIRAGQNPFDYLTALQRYRSLVSKNPDAWLPWNFQLTLASLRSSK